MTASNLLTTAPPYEVEQAMKRLGANLRTARLRRNLTIDEVAAKIGTGPRAVMNAEKGKPSTGAVVYLALLWTYGLLDPVTALADPAKDEEGLTLELARGRTRARAKDELDDDF
ncbi:helix-turn-helix domain-containing protein [Thiorhodococcus minor]|uniref:Helix-turn-helix transcriptional regulator n=1 Tax=Thiorhodococcus minor TaxID=57489 RepID=A0A6M0K4N2_9GAMM|nr:helix-turn-helix transcriptional regulator [Thiorhodococcus minor]NEV64722.1 helix-turn-helix transcriptional regulator [Thiorhodococcus minor]